MTDQNQQYPWLKWIFISGGLFLIWFALRFYFERLYTDSGYYFYHTVNGSGFHIEHGRFVLALAEFLPRLGLIAGLSLKTLAILYSLNHVLFSLVLCFICWRYLKQYQAALLILLLQFAGIRYTVVTPQFELYYGLSLLVLLQAYLQFAQQDNKSGFVHYLIVLTLSVFIFTSHPMAIYCLGLSLILFFPLKQNKALYFILALFFLAYYLWKQTTISDYEQGKFSHLGNVLSAEGIKQLVSLHIAGNGIKLLLTYYADIMIISAVGVYFYFKQNGKGMGIVFITGLLILTGLIWLMFPPQTIDRYLEQVYFPLVFSGMVWIVFIRINQYIFILLMSIMVYRSVGMVNTGLHYSGRTRQIGELINNAEGRFQGQRFFITKQSSGDEFYDMGNWSLGIETLIYSAMHKHRTISITKDEDLYYNHNDSLLKPDEFLPRPFDRVSIHSLNKKYFSMDTGRYQLLN